MDHIETHYDFRIEIYKDVRDSQIYCSINNESRKLLDDPILMEKMKEYKIFSIDVFPKNKIEIEIDTTPFFEKRKFITRYLSENTEKAGVLIDEDTFSQKANLLLIKAMKTDRYTKIILSIIDACMVINVIEKIDILPKAYAGESAVKPSGNLGDNPAYGLVPLNKDGSINVKMTAPTDVNVIGIKTDDELNVNVNLAKMGGYSTYGEIPVKVKE